MKLEVANDLIEIKRDNALEIFTTPSEVDKIVADVRARADASRKNIEEAGLWTAETEEGRTAIKRLKFAVVKSRTALEGFGKGLAKEAKELPGKIDAGRNAFIKKLGEIEDEIIKPVTEWETKDKARQDAHLAKIESLKGYVAGIDTDQETIRGLLAAAAAVTVGPECEEFEDGYRLAKENAVSGLAAALAARIKYDADQAELAALREKQRLADEAEAERMRLQRIREREEQVANEAIAEAARKHQAELERVRLEGQARIDEADRRAREEAALVEAARVRLVSEEREAAEELKRRENSRLHRQKVGAEAAAALILKVEGITEAMALDVVRAIARGEIPHLKVEW